MRCQPAHGVEGHRVAGDGVVLLPPGIGPGDRQFDPLVARGDAHFVRKAADTRRGNAGDVLRPLRRVFLHPLQQQLESRLYRGAIFQPVGAQQRRVGTWRVIGHRAAAEAVPPQLIVAMFGVVALRGVAGTHRHALLRTRRVDVDQVTGVAVTREEGAVVKPGLEDLVGQRQQQRAIGAGADRHPFVGDRRVTGAHRIHRNETPAAALEFRDRDFQRIGMVVLGGADHHEQFRAVEIGATEFPEAAADGVDHARGHVDRTEAAVCRVVRRAELAREHAGQRLHLVAAGEQGKLLGVGRTDLAQAFLHDRERLVPADRLELAGTALGARLAPQRPRQPRRRILLHDPRSTLGADHALVQRMLGIALDVADFAVFQMHADAAAASAHIAGGVPGFGDCGRTFEGGIHGTDVPF